MATFESKIINEHGVARTKLADDIDDLVMKMMDKVESAVEIEQLSVSDITLLESFLSSSVHSRFSDIRLRKQMQERRLRKG